MVWKCTIYCTYWQASAFINIISHHEITTHSLHHWNWICPANSINQDRTYKFATNYDLILPKCVYRVSEEPGHTISTLERFLHFIMLQYLIKGKSLDWSLDGDAGRHCGVGFFAIESDLAFITFQGANVTHLDRTDCKLKEEIHWVERKICHKSLVNPPCVL